MKTTPPRSFAASTALWFLILLAGSLPPAATVNTGTLVTGFSAPPSAPAPAVNESTTATVDLSNLTGLTPGHDVIVTFTTADFLIWVGAFNADEDELTLNYQARFTLTVGTYTAQSTETWVLRPPAMARRKQPRLRHPRRPTSLFLPHRPLGHQPLRHRPHPHRPQLPRHRS